MGYSCGFRCAVCGCVKAILFGYGKNYRSTQQRVLSAVKNGDYGVAMQRTAIDTPGIKVDIEWYLFICPECGTWKNDYGLSLYEPDQPENDDDDDLVLPTESDSNYHVKLQYDHKCPSCGKTMYCIRDDVKPVRCPKCHHEGHLEFCELWD